MNQITKKCVKPGNHHETSTEILGVKYPVIVGYEPVKGYPANEIEPGVDDYVEVLSVMLEIGGDLIEVGTSQEWDEEIAEEIQDKLNC